MRKIIIPIAQSALYHFFLMLMPVAAILDMICKMDFTDFHGKISHSIAVLQFANCFVTAERKEEQWLG